MMLNAPFVGFLSNITPFQNCFRNLQFHIFFPCRLFLEMDWINELQQENTFNTDPV